MDYSFYNCLSIEGQSELLPVLSVMNEDAVNIHTQVSI